MQALIETWITRNVPHCTGDFMITDSEESRRAAKQLSDELTIDRVPSPRSRAQHNQLVARYRGYVKECEKNGVISRGFADWLEYYNIENS